MTSSTRQLTQISLLLILTLKISLVLSTKPEVSLVLTPPAESFSSDRFLQDRGPNNNQMNCPTNRWCTLQVSDNVQYTVVMSANSYLTNMIMISYYADTTLTVTYSSSSSSTQIETELDVSVGGGSSQRSVTIDTPTTSSYTTTISQDTIQAYAGGAVYFSVTNESDNPTTITIKMAYGDGSGSSLTDTSDGGVSLINIIIPIAGTLMFIFILGICCHYRRKRQEQERMARAMRGRGRGRRVRGAARNAEGQQADEEEEDEEIEDPLTEQNIGERFPECKFGNHKSSFPQTTCSVCLEEFQKGVACRQLYCEHMFHSECIRLWLVNQLKKGHAFCPNCNKDMMSKPSEAPKVEVQA